MSYYFSKSCLDHKLNIDSIDIDGALSAFIPEAVRMQHNMKVRFVSLFIPGGSVRIRNRSVVQ